MESIIKSTIKPLLVNSEVLTKKHIFCHHRINIGFRLDKMKK